MAVNHSPSLLNKSVEWGLVMKCSTNYFEKGNELLSQKKYAEAVQCYEKDVKNGRSINRSKVMFNMGIAYNYLGKYKKAVKCYEEALKDKNYPSPYKALNTWGTPITG